MPAKEEEEFYRFPLAKNGHVVTPKCRACSATTVHDLAHLTLQRVASRCTTDSLQHLLANSRCRNSASRVVRRYCALLNLTPVIVL